MEGVKNSIVLKANYYIWAFCHTNKYVSCKKYRTLALNYCHSSRCVIYWVSKPKSALNKGMSNTNWSDNLPEH